VWCVTVPGLDPDAAVVVASLDSYGVDDLFADESGKIYLWLPNGVYAFTASGTAYMATVDGAAMLTTQHFSIDTFTLADNMATFTLASRLAPDVFATWMDTVTFEVQFSTNLTDAVWTALIAPERDGITLTVPFATDAPSVFLRVLAQ
ncbi:MAG: hypothetical protein PHX00_13520, partial [Synergistaceae bacterium]|nr:hypothetical protein [Synergistaceae bacterium]